MYSLTYLENLVKTLPNDWDISFYCVYDYLLFWLGISIEGDPNGFIHNLLSDCEILYDDLCYETSRSIDTREYYDLMPECDLVYG
jgi:hypothetical protein